MTFLHVPLNVGAREEQQGEDIDLLEEGCSISLFLGLAIAVLEPPLR
jgi:hypothetical protein